MLLQMEQRRRLVAQDEDGVGEGAGVFVGAAQEVEGEALGGFGADAGELAQLVDEAGDGVGEAGHAATPDRGG